MKSLQFFALAAIAGVLFLEAPPWAAGASFELSEYSFQIRGVDAGDETGFSVALLPDANGDGYSDLLIGAPYRNGKGAAYLVFGKKGFGELGFLNLGALGAGGVVIEGEATDDHLGWCVLSLGDLNNDSLSDFALSAPGYDGLRSEAGRCYIIYGRSDFGATLDLAGLGPDEGAFIDGAAAWDMIGVSMALAGNFTGQGFPCLLVGAPYADRSSSLAAGAAYVIYLNGALPQQLDLAALGGQGIELSGSRNFENAGYALGGNIDFDNDGVSDIAIGVPGAYYEPLWYTHPGRVYVVRGGTGLTGSLSLDSLGGGVAAVFDGAEDYDQAGCSVAGAGDFNGDGFGDVALASPFALSTGVVYVVHGSAPSPVYPVVDLGALGAGGTVFLGAQTDDGYMGIPLADLGDVTYDGKADLAIGFPGADAGLDLFAGRTHLLAGGVAYGGTQTLGALAAKESVFLGSEIGIESGYSLAGGGDVNGDGLEDILIGARGFSHSGKENMGLVYFVPGPLQERFQWPWTSPTTGEGTLGQGMEFVPELIGFGDSKPGSEVGLTLAAERDPSWPASSPLGLWIMKSQQVYESGLVVNDQVTIWPVIDASTLFKWFPTDSSTGLGFQHLVVPAGITPGKRFYLQLFWQNSQPPFDYAATNCLHVQIQ